VWLPTPDDLRLYDGRLVLEWRRIDPESGDEVAKLASAGHDPATSTVDLQTFFDVWPPSGGQLHRVARRDRLRLVTADELVRMARDAGLTVDTLASDYELNPFGPGAERVVLVGGLL
jgi:hypothetical protein